MEKAQLSTKDLMTRSFHLRRSINLAIELSTAPQLILVELAQRTDVAISYKSQKAYASKGAIISVTDLAPFRTEVHRSISGAPYGIGGASIGPRIYRQGHYLAEPHTVRGAIAGALKKKLGLDVSSQKDDKRGCVYRNFGLTGTRSQSCEGIRKCT